MAQLLLGSATRSVLDSVRTDLRTMLAIACSDRSDWAMHPSQVAASPPSLLPPGKKNERAWKDHRESQIGSVSAIVEERKPRKKDTVAPLI